MKQRYNTLKRIIRTGILNFIRNAWLGMAAMAVMIITLSIVLFSVIANATFNHTVEDITNRIDISVYLKKDVKDGDKDKLVGAVKALPQVKIVDFVTSEQAQEQFLKDNADDPDLSVAISQAGGGYIPATIRVKPYNLDDLEAIKSSITKADEAKIIKDISYKKDRKKAIDNITQATSFFRRAGIFGVLIFALISMLIIFNTIQMAIFNRRDEITIMRLLGASTNYIRGPFIVESIIYGLVSGSLSIVILQSIFTIMSSTLNASSLGLLDITFSTEYYANHYWTLLGLQLAVGVLIGAFSSLIATRRYLKFKTTK